MPVLYVRLSIMCALALAVVGVAMTSEWETERAIHAATPLQRICAPCGEVIPADAVFVTLHGKRWAVCGEPCATLASEDPVRFASAAIE